MLLQYVLYSKVCTSCTRGAHLSLHNGAQVDIERRNDAELVKEACNPVTA